MITFLFKLCKKRTLKRTNSLSYQRSSSSNPNSVKKNSKKSYKHIETIELEDIKYIFNESSNSEGMSQTLMSGITRFESKFNSNIFNIFNNFKY